MKILVVNGSPKGEKSVTLQTMLYLQKRFPGHEFSFLHAAKQLARLEKDLTPALEQLDAAELVLFSYPVYTFLVPSQLHRFLELLKASGKDFSGKYASQFSTSKHFYDVTAHRFLEENVLDLGMRYIRGLSADMEDLTTARGRSEADAFLRFLEWSAAAGQYEEQAPREYPAAPPVPASAAEPCEKTLSGDVVIVTDCEQDNLSLRSMIERFRAVLPAQTRVVNIREYPIKGGCLGCLNCAATGVCIYKDGFSDLLRNEIQRADATVYAFSVRDHSMGSCFKKYDDRQFCNGHRTVTMGSPVAYLIHGCYSAEQNLRMVLEARAETGGNFFTGTATDEKDPDKEIDALARRLAYVLETGYSQPKNFYGVGGMRIFRDLIYEMQGIMKLDHRFFKEHGQYDFPQKKKGTILLMYAAGVLFSSDKLRKKLGSRIDDGMIAAYRKVIEEAEPCEEPQ